MKNLNLRYFFLTSEAIQEPTL